MDRPVADPSRPPAHRPLAVAAATTLAALVAAIAAALLVAPPAGAQPYAYATRVTADEVTVVDLATGSVETTLPTGRMPSGAAVTPDGAWLFVAESADAQVRAVDLESGATTVIPVGGGPSGVAADPAAPRIYVANSQDDTVSVIDVPSLAVVDTVPVGRIPMALAADGSRVWVADFGADTVSVIDSTTLAVSATVPVGGLPAGVAVSPDASRVWVANLFDATVSVIDPTGPTVISTVPLPTSPAGLAVTPAGDRVFVAGFGSGQIIALDGTSGNPVGSVQVGLNAADVAVTPGGDRVLVTDPASGELAVLDVTTLQPLAPLPAGVGHVTLAGFTTGAASLDVPALGPVGLPVLAMLLAATALLLLRLRQGSAILALPLAALVATLPAPAAHAQTPFQIDDGTLDTADWEVITTAPSSEQSAVQGVVDGNPGTYRTMSHSHFRDTSTPYSVEVIHRFVGSGGTYDPAVMGAVTSLDASWDRRANLDGVSGVEEALVIVQDGTAYTTGTDTFTAFEWTATSHDGLTAADFDDGAGNQPDLSAAGGPLTFGFLRRTVSAFGFAGHDLDNFSITVTPADTPGGDPGTLAFEHPSYVGVSRETVTLRVLRAGGSDGDVSATVQVPVAGGLGGTASLPVSWSDGDAAPKSVDVDLSGLPLDGAILEARPILTGATGGADLHPVRDKAILLILPAENGELAALAVLLRLLFSAGGPWWLLLATLGAAYAWWRRRSATAAAPAASPADAP